MDEEITFKCPGCEQSFTEVRTVYPDDYEFPRAIPTCVTCFKESLTFPPEDYSFIPLSEEPPIEKGTFQEREYKRIKKSFDKGRIRKQKEETNGN